MKELRTATILNYPGLFGSALGVGVVHVLVFLDGEFQLAKTLETSHPRKRRWDELNKGVRSSKKAKDGGSMAFSNFTYPMVETALPATTYRPPSKDIDEDKFAAVDLYFPILAKVFGEIGFGKEAKRLHFIVPMLATVCALFEDVEILAEEAIVGKRVLGHGAFEFVLKRGNKRVCIVEAKRDDLQQGVAQAYVGSEVLADLEGLPVVHSIVKDFTRWIFSRSLDEKIERSSAVMLSWEEKEERQVPAPQSVRQIAGMIYAILSDDYQTGNQH